MSEEYINRELLENAFEDENKNGNFVFTANWIMEIVDNLPNADVVPKSKVARMLAECERLIKVHLNCAEYSDGDLAYDFAELKKKYTGVENGT